MENAMNSSKLKEQQYAKADRFNIRFYFHARFGANKYPWPCWVFDQIEKTEPAKVLELGCGNGMLWKVNAGRIPAGWDITVSDFSAGMLEETNNALSDIGRPVSYAIIDAVSIPYPDQSFDIVIANHMLYHIARREQALSEIKRVLKPTGVFYASTIGLNHMRELQLLLTEFDPDSEYEAAVGSIHANFCLENGTAQLVRHFPSVLLREYPDSLMVTEAQPLVDYMLSCNGLTPGRTALRPDQSEDFKRFILTRIQADGPILISKPSGMFIGKRTVC